MSWPFFLFSTESGLAQLAVKTLYIAPAGPCGERQPMTGSIAWSIVYCESFNSKLRDELLAREIFYDLREAKARIENLEGLRQHNEQVS